MPQLEKYKTKWWREHYMHTKYGVVTTRKRHPKMLRDTPRPPKIDRGDRRYIATIQRYDKKSYKKGDQIRGSFAEVDKSDLKSKNFDDAVDEAVEKLGAKVVNESRKEAIAGDPDASFELEIEENLGHGSNVVEKSTDLSVMDIITYKGADWFVIEEPEIDPQFDPKIYGSLPDRRFVKVDKSGEKKEILTYVINPEALKRKKKSGKRLTSLERNMLEEYKDDVNYHPQIPGIEKRRKRTGKGRGNEKKAFKKAHPFIYVIYSKFGNRKREFYTHNATKEDTKGSNYNKKNFKDELDALRTTEKQPTPSKVQIQKPHAVTVKKKVIPTTKKDWIMSGVMGGTGEHYSKEWRWGRQGGIQTTYKEPSYENIRGVPPKMKFKKEGREIVIERPPLPPSADLPRDQYMQQRGKFVLSTNAFQKKHGVKKEQLDDYYTVATENDQFDEDIVEFMASSR